MNKLNNPYAGGNDEWMIAAFDAAAMEFDLLCRRAASRVFPIVPCNHPADEWESCLGQGCNMPSAEQECLYSKMFTHYAVMATEAITRHMVEPVDSYFGTSSCWKNAASRGIEAISRQIVALDWMILPEETTKDRNVVVEEREGVFFLITEEVPDGDQLIDASRMINDQQDSPYSTYLGVVRRDARGWYRRVEECDRYSVHCTGIGFETVHDPVCVAPDGSCDYLCGVCQYEAGEDR